MESPETGIRALIKAQKEMGVVPKSGENKFDKYKYATLEDFLNIVQPVLAENNLSLTTSIDETQLLPDRTTKAGGMEHVVQIKGTMTLFHDSGEVSKIAIFGQGQDRADKGIYKAITGARKYGLACFFNLVTTDEPEADETVGLTPAPKANNKQKANPPMQGTKKSSPAELLPSGYTETQLSLLEDLKNSLAKCRSMEEIETWKNNPENSRAVKSLPDKLQHEFCDSAAKFKKTLPLKAAK